MGRGMMKRGGHNATTDNYVGGRGGEEGRKDGDTDHQTFGFGKWVGGRGTGSGLGSLAGEATGMRTTNWGGRGGALGTQRKKVGGLGPRGRGGEDHSAAGPRATKSVCWMGGRGLGVAANNSGRLGPARPHLHWWRTLHHTGCAEP